MSERVAYHESAHALTGWYYGFKLSKVTMRPQPGDPQNVSGFCSATPGGGRTEIVSQPKLLSNYSVYFTIGGKVSDDLFFPDEPAGHGRDYQDLSRMRPMNSSTLSMHRFNWANKTMDDFYEAFRGPVVRLLKSTRGRRSLDALAGVLMKAGTISGAGAVSVLEKAWGTPLPRMAVPAAMHATLTDEPPRSYHELLRLLVAHLELMRFDTQQLRGGDLPEEENNHLDRLYHQIKILRAILG